MNRVGRVCPVKTWNFAGFLKKEGVVPQEGVVRGVGLPDKQNITCIPNFFATIST